MEMRSTFICSTSKGSLPIPCTASLWKRIPLSFTTAPISAMGCTVPISLFANMMETRMVLSVIALRTCSGETRPSLSTSR